MTRSSRARLLAAGCYLLAALAAAAVSIPAVIVLSRLARTICVLVPPLEPLLYSPRLFDAAAFAFTAALAALSHYYLASLLALYGSGRWFRAGCAAGGALACGFFFEWITGQSRLGTYALCWLPAAAGALLGAYEALTQDEEFNPWPAGAAGFFPSDN